MASLNANVQPANVQPTIFREYIGSQKLLTQLFPDIINPRVDQFHFILAFATEVYDETKKRGTGTFNINWNRSSFDVNSIMDLKGKNPNVKVIISIGGRGKEFPFDPTDVTINWVDEAKKSLKDILNQFKDSDGINLIDGIDVYYDKIINHGDFVECIGELIKSLKEDKLIKVASISPSNDVRPQYMNLYQTYRDYIDWVNYQFYYQNVMDKTEFINLYNNLALDYSHEKLLVGFSTDSNDADHISETVFFDGCQDLLRRKLLPGISVWDADSSAFPPTHDNPFHVEILAQQIIIADSF